MVNAERLVNAFVEELVLSIKLLSLSQSSSGRSNDSQKMFGLILKLLKVVQNEHQHVGGEFEEAVNDPNVPKWIFLYFLPQIIRTLNSFDLVRSFKGLFEIILANYPEALVYVFNCTYPSRTDCLTP